MKKNILNNLQFSLIIYLIFWSCTNRNTPIILRFGHQANESDIWHKSSLKLKEYVEELSIGNIEVRVYPAEQLRRERDLIRSIEAGIVDMKQAMLVMIYMNHKSMINIYNWQ